MLLTVNCPVTEPAVVGSNWMLSVTLPGEVRVSGKVAPEKVKPVPLIVTELMVTDAPPLELKVTVCVVGVFRFTLPKLMLDALRVRVGEGADSCRVKVLVTVPALAVNVTVCALETAATVAVKPAVVAPAATVTEAGTVTAVLLLARPTASPPVAAAAFSVTVQLSVPAPLMDEFVQETAVSTGTPVPLKAMAVDAPVDELLASVSWPVAAPATVGSNCTVRLAVAFGFNVKGNVTPEIEKPEPVTVAAVRVTGPVPDEPKVTVCVVAVLTETFPKLTVEVLMVSVGTVAFNCNAKVCETPATLAVSVAVWAVTTAVTIAEKVALVAPAATVTDAGTVTALLLLAKLTAKPPVPAAAFMVIVHASVAAPVMDAFVHESPVKVGTPVPVKATEVEDPEEELLVSVSWPVAAPVAVGSNWTVRLAV